MQNIGILQRPFFYDMAVDDNSIYFPMAFYNALCKGNLTNNQVNILAVFPETPSYEYCAYAGVFNFKNYLLFDPHKYNKNKYFLLYDCSRSKFIKLPNEDNSCSNSIYERNGKIYCVSRNTAQINVIDLQKLSVKCISCNKHISDNAQTYEMVKVDGMIYIPQNEKRIMVVFDLDREEFRYYDFPINIICIVTICYVDGEFWITQKNNKLYKWKMGEIEAHEVAEYPGNIKLFYKENIWFSHSFTYKETLWLFPCYTDAILNYNLLTNKFEKIEIMGEEESIDQVEEELKNGRGFATKYGRVHKCGDKVYFLSSKTRIFYELNLHTRNISRHIFKVNNNYNNQLYPPSVKGIMSEIYYTEGIKYLIKGWESGVVKDNMRKHLDKPIGKIINDYIC